MQAKVFKKRERGEEQEKAFALRKTSHYRRFSPHTACENKTAFHKPPCNIQICHDYLAKDDTPRILGGRILFHLESQKHWQAAKYLFSRAYTYFYIFCKILTYFTQIPQ